MRVRNDIKNKCDNLQDTLDMLDNIVQLYIAEDRIFNPYGSDAKEYIGDKEMYNIIAKVTENILVEISDDVMIALSSFFKPDQIKSIINRRVAIGVITLVRNINNSNMATEKNNNPQRQDDLARLIRSFSEEE